MWPKLSNLEASVPSFVGGMLTFLKPGSDLVGMWRVAKSLFLSMKMSFAGLDQYPSCQLGSEITTQECSTLILAVQVLSL